MVLTAAALAGAAAAYKSPTTAPATEPAATTQAAAAADANSSVARLVTQVLADPANIAARTRLAGIRESQAAEDLGACEALMNGLDVYLRVGAEAALPGLERAARSKLAVALTASMSKPLNKWLLDVREEAQTEAAARGRLCPMCGGLGQKACTATGCYGSGKIPCEKCKGSGGGRLLTMRCAECNGSGESPCRACGGSGLMDCTCQKGAAPKITPRVTHAREVQIRETIDKIRWVRAGGIDLYTDGALRCGAR
jgi:hypothetical protein